MKQKHHSLVLAGLLALAFGVTACSSMHKGTDTSGGSTGGATGSGSEYGAPAGGAAAPGASGTSGTSGASGSGTEQGTSGTSGTTGMSAEQGTSGTAGSMDQSQGAAAAMGATPSAVTPNATVVSIETVPRQEGAATGAGSMAGAAVGGSTAGATGSSMPDHVYRVTLRMDDGSTKLVTQETTPSYRAGDRINLTSGVIQH